MEESKKRIVVIIDDEGRPPLENKEMHKQLMQGRHVGFDIIPQPQLDVYEIEKHMRLISFLKEHFDYTGVMREDPEHVDHS